MKSLTNQRHGQTERRHTKRAAANEKGFLAFPHAPLDQLALMEWRRDRNPLLKGKGLAA
jgi:hypothetical protein